MAQGKSPRNPLAHSSQPCWAKMTRSQRKKWKKWGGKRGHSDSSQGRASPLQLGVVDRRLPGH